MKALKEHEERQQGKGSRRPGVPLPDLHVLHPNEASGSSSPLRSPRLCGRKQL